MTMPPGPTDRNAPPDDYHVMQPFGQPEPRRPAAYYILAVLRIIVLLIILATSFALFWVVARLLGFI